MVVKNNGRSSMNISVTVPGKNEFPIISRSRYATLGHSVQKESTSSYRNTCISMSISALFIIAKIGNSLDVYQWRNE